MNDPLPAMKSSMIVVEWKVGSPYGFDMGMAVVVVCMAGPPIEKAAKFKSKMLMMFLTQRRSIQNYKKCFC